MHTNFSNAERAEVLTAALPYIKKYSGKTVVIKYGGNAMINEELKQQVMEDIALLWLIGVKVVLVHGGGPEISQTMKQLGKEAVFIDGLRVTDKETVDIVQMVLAGKINKTLVNLIQMKGGHAVGLSGIDGGILEAKIKDERLGYVGEITKVRPQPIQDLLEKNYIPVVSTVASDRQGNTYNINGDTAAAYLAGALGAERLIMMTDIAGILRDKDRMYSGYSREHCLYAKGAGLYAFAEKKGYRITRDESKTYGLNFTEDGTPAEGEIADKVTLNFIYGRAKKETVMVYNAKLDKYVWNQYGKEMTDQITGDIEAFTNVIIMQAEITNNGIYHAADFCAGGTGYYANGGMLVPIYWTCADEDSAFEFFTNDGEPLELGVGNTYIAICSHDSEITYEEVIPPETEPPTEAPTEPAETVEETISETAAETSAETLSIDETEDCAG